MSLFSSFPDHGERFGAETKKVFVDALDVLNKEKSDTRNPLLNDIDFLNLFRQKLECWVSNFTLSPRATLGGGISGLTSEYAEPVYRALDEAVIAFNGVTTNCELASAEREPFAERVKRGLEAFVDGDDGTSQLSLPLPELRRFVELGIEKLKRFDD